ncbi:MAG: hypothetical protein ACD_3C00061G0008 [uncultured bacterium (gcode 4)]|uniref:Histidine kinase/HSP90-like ATPase domain-containing protein n=1 Tax=uncultured bacterium (gcode 4) TaxID=1234023 RepID=K2GDR0_9BACT|nr:MAG: hypothetical protein ACD_3C00061G0008 [uncultured bacterium (gcode 4)]
MNLDISNIENQELLDYISKNMDNFKDFEVAILFRSDYSQWSIIRNLIVFLLEKAWMEPMWKNRFSLIWDELINNSIEYWSLPLDKNIFRIKLKSDEGAFQVMLEVQDTWRWLMAKTSSQMEEIRKDKEEEWFEVFLGKRWRWLFKLVLNIVDRLYFGDAEWGWLIVWIEKKINLIPN